MAQKAEHDVLLNLPPKSSLREYMYKINERFKEENIDMKLMTKESSLKNHLRKRRDKEREKRPSITSFFDLGNLKFDFSITFNF